MVGFFDLPQKASMKGTTCTSCGLYKFVLSPRMLPYGKFKKEIMTIGEAPGEFEDKRGKQWQGKVGQRLQQAFTELGYDLFEDCINFNSINCRPTDSKGNNREPEPNEIACCRSRVLKAIEEYKPKVIIILGNSSVTSLIGHRWKKDLGGISKWRGWTIPDRDLHAWLCPVFHPSYVEREDREVESIWMSDLENALSMSKKTLPTFSDELKKVEIVEDLSTIEIRSPFAFDWETTGLKPHDTSIHDIICGSICDSKDKAYAFMMTKKNRAVMKHWLESNKWEKIAANIKFEHAWCYNIFQCEVKNWLFDTMIASHVLDNRPDITSVKFQAYVQFGLVDYASEVSPYLVAKDNKNGNAENKIRELIKSPSGLKKLLLYCGIDSIIEYMLAEVQMKQLGLHMKCRQA
jgi:uracil-DNA glycosylase family 4